MKTVPMIHSERVNKLLLILNVVVLFIYMSWWFNFSHMGNPYLYSLLLLGEIYHSFMALSFWFTLWPAKPSRPLKLVQINPSVDIYITVAGEPLEIVKKTAIAARDLDYANHKVYLLNDSFVAQKIDWHIYEKLASELKINCITRKIPGGAKAGNINNALGETSSEIIVIFDADMVPHADFLKKVIPYFSNTQIGFVQTPQYYNNHQTNIIAAGAWEQQALFFGPIMKGKEKSNASFICGTNVAIRRTALDEVGGMNETNIAEDFLTSLSMHQKGWKSYYLDEVLAEGLAPEDLLSYFKQQLRWARGSLEVLFGFNPLFKKSLTIAQKIEYISSALYYFNGVIVIVNAFIPLLFLFTGAQPVLATTSAFAFYFIPFITLNLLTLYLASGGTFTFRAISFSQASCVLQTQALISVILHQKMSFAVTPKQAQTGNFMFLVYPHLIYILLFLIALTIGILRDGITPSVTTNIAWGAFNIIMFIPFIEASFKLKQNNSHSPSIALQI